MIKIFNSKYENIITKSILEEDMYKLKLSQREIAKKWNVGKGTIQNLQYKYGLEILSIQQKRVPETLSYEQKQLIFGSVLADGHIFRKNDKRHGAIKFCHSIKQEKYLYYKYDLMKDFVRTAPTKGISRVKNSVSIYKSFRTLTHPFFTELHKMFYKKDKNNKYVKHISKEILENMDEMALAISYMDDGTKRPTVRDFCFECFPIEEQKMFCKWLKTKYKIEAKSIKYKNGFRIRILRTSVNKFVETIRPYILNSMKYKL